MEHSKIEKVSASHRKLYTDIIIDATAAQVWSVLADTSSYKDWAAFMVDFEGEIVDKGNVTATFQLNPQKEKFEKFSHEITAVEGVGFFWSDKMTGGILDNHHFKVEAHDDGKAKFIQTDEFTGGLTWLLGGYITKMLQNGYVAFNQSLKTEVERRFNKA